MRDEVAIASRSRSDVARVAQVEEEVAPKTEEVETEVAPRAPVDTYVVGKPSFFQALLKNVGYVNNAPKL